MSKHINWCAHKSEGCVKRTSFVVKYESIFEPYVGSIYFPVCSKCVIHFERNIILDLKDALINLILDG